MASSLISPLLVGQMTRTGQNRFTSTSASLSQNGILIDVSFEVPAGYKDRWEFLRDLYLTVSYRMGIGNGTAISLISSCSVYALLGYSDFVAGVSMQSTTFAEGKTARISGYIETGYFEMRSNDALEVSLVWGGTEKPEFPVNFAISNVYKKSMLSWLKTYQSSSPTGADQPYKNVLGVYYDSEDPVSTDAVITDQITTQNINVQSAIALSNATGRFEFFTNFGELYSEPFEISQDVSIRVPTNNSRAELLIVGLAFYPELLASNASVTDASRSALLQEIQSSDSEKYNYLNAMGLA